MLSSDTNSWKDSKMDSDTTVEKEFKLIIGLLFVSHILIYICIKSIIHVQLTKSDK